MRNKQVVGILAGGKSAEHEVSLRSAATILENIDKKKYHAILISINKDGNWVNAAGESVILNPNAGAGQLILAENGMEFVKLDVLFPILHGPYGEDGSVQGLAKLAEVPCVGPGILSSAAAMDKEIMKRLLKDQGIDVGKFRVWQQGEKPLSYVSLAREMGKVMFVKPANMGSSIGISRIENKKQFQLAVNQALHFDHKIIIEQEIVGREIEVAVLGNQEPEASLAGELVAPDNFYSYEEKYSDQSQTKLIIPAQVTKAEQQQIEQVALAAYRALACTGMARVDLFLESSEKTAHPKILVNEINTLPGFTSISMYPKLWEASGKNITQLIDELIQLAHLEFKRQQSLVSIAS